MHRESDTYCKDMRAWRKTQSAGTQNGQTPWPQVPPGTYPPSQNQYPNPYQQYPQQPYYGPQGYQQGGYQQPAPANYGTSPGGAPDAGTTHQGDTDPRPSGDAGTDTGDRP
jgi:hypothetical protein